MSRIGTHYGPQDGLPLSDIASDGGAGIQAVDALELVGIDATTPDHQALEMQKLQTKLMLDEYFFHEDGAERVMYLNQSGLYRLIMTTDTPQTRLFRNWVYRHVLPILCCARTYSVGEEIETGGNSQPDKLREFCMSLPI